MVTAGTRITRASVLRALAEIPDPEIPVVSVVDLGVVADVRVEGERVEVDFTPTFMGCPALDTMRAQMEDAIRGLGAEPDVRVVLDDSWSTDRISAEGREKLRAAGFAPTRTLKWRRSFEDGNDFELVFSLDWSAINQVDVWIERMERFLPVGCRKAVDSKIACRSSFESVFCRLVDCSQ